MFRALFKSAFVWVVYFPQVTALRLMGPHCAILCTRALSLVYWLMTFIGAARRTRRAMARLLPEIRPDLRVGSVLHRHLVVKHQFFTEWHLYPTARGRRFVERTYGELEGREHLDAALAGGRGAIVLGHHFGMFRMALPALEGLGYKTHHHVLRGASYAGETYGSVAQAVLSKKVNVDEGSGLNVIYHRPSTAFRTMVRLLKQNAVVALACDGMTGSAFVEAPFLGGMMLFPTGPARLAASTGAAIVPMFCLLEGITRHRLIAHPPMYCEDKSPDAVERTVRAYARLTEEYTRTYPWAWWTWRRLDVAEASGGQFRFNVFDLPTRDGMYYAPQPAPRLETP